MSEQEKAKLIEERLPTVEAVIEEYRAQGKELTREAAEKIREQLRAALAAGHVDARDDVLGDDVLEKIAGEAGGAPFPTSPHRNPDNHDGGSTGEYLPRQS